MSPNQTTPTVRELLGESFSLICVTAVYGPPVLFVLAPWLLLGLLLSGPFALLMTFALAAVALVAGIGALLATPYLVVRRLRTAPVARPAAARVQVAQRRVAA